MSALPVVVGFIGIVEAQNRDTWLQHCTCSAWRRIQDELVPTFEAALGRTQVAWMLFLAKAAPR